MRRLVVLLVLVFAFAGWATPLSADEPLTTDTPVVGIWRDSSGKEVGRYSTTLGKLNDVGMQVTDHETRLDDIDALIHALVTDPKLRGHLLRHDMTVEQLDDIARRFDKR